MIHLEKELEGMKKTLLVLLLTIIVLITACGAPTVTPSTDDPPKTNDSTDSTPTKAAEKDKDEPITLHAFQYVLENQQVDFENLWFYKELEERTGIHVDWELVKDGDWKTRLNLMFASSNWPDVIIRGDVDVEEYGVTQEILVPLDDYLKDSMPNYYSRLFMNSADASIPASDGKMYYIGNLTAQNINHDGNHYINKSWLDKLGLGIPETIDELTNVLRAFRDNDMNGNGENDEIPFSAADLIHQTQGVYTHFANFGVPLQRWVYACIDDDQNVVFPGHMDGFRACCEWLHMCYDERIT